MFDFDQIKADAKNLMEATFKKARKETQLKTANIIFTKLRAELKESGKLSIEGLEKVAREVFAEINK